MPAESFSFVDGLVSVLDEEGGRLVAFPAPDVDGLYEVDSSGEAASITLQDVEAATGAVIVVEGGQPYGVKLPTADYRPLRRATRAEINAFVDGLTAAQLRRALAWVIFQLRDQLPDDVRNRIN